VAAPAKAKDLTKTAAFKRWFGDSKVVDKKGKPLVAYHGSPEYGFKVFDLEKIDAHHVGFFFTDKRDMANTYAEGKPGQRPKRSGIYEVYLRIEEPFEVDAKGAIWDNIPLEYEDWDGTVVEERASTITISRTARDLGHDGCIIHNVYDGWGDQRGDVFVVFKPNQVKSVDNRGTFSRYDDNIRNPKRMPDGGYTDKVNGLIYKVRQTGEGYWSVRFYTSRMVAYAGVDLASPFYEASDEFRTKREAVEAAIQLATDPIYGLAKMAKADDMLLNSVEGRRSIDHGIAAKREYLSKRNPAERTFIPPPAVAAEARKALDLRAKQPPSNRCCTPVGIARAKQLANRQPVSETTLRRMKAYFDRHAVDAKGKGWGVDSKGWQAWLAWGGTPGRKWCENILRSL
jgi:hypothetical protein